MQQGHQGQLCQGDLQQAGGLLPAIGGGGPSGQEGRDEGRCRIIMSMCWMSYQNTTVSLAKYCLSMMAQMEWMELCKVQGSQKYLNYYKI